MTGVSARTRGESAAYMELAALPSAPFWARRHTRDTLREWHMLAETIETAELLVSELVTNAVKFTSPVPARYSDLERAERISLTLRYLTGQVVIEVSDSDEKPPQMADANLNAESGRGLMLVDALSKEWSYFLPPSGGKTVYCVLSADEPAHMPATKPEEAFIHDR
jgi:anti-sigma regulatory factor (Ser/Thr protein kinase)